jgi:alpha-D-xyloside xylohydrolase
MAKITLVNNRIMYQKRDELTVIEPYGENCLRCRSTRNSVISEEAWTLLPPSTEDACVVTGNAEKATIANGDISATIDIGTPWSGKILTFSRKGTQILRNKNEGDAVNQFVHVEGDHYSTKVIFYANEGEHFYGLGQEQEDAFDRKGSVCDLVHYNTKSVIPYFYSSLGYGFLWNNPSPGRCETTRNHTLWCADSAYQADYLIFAGDTPAKVMKIYCDLTGYVPKFPQWASGFWQCKLRYEDQEDLLSVAREYKQRGIPISAVVIDFFHWTEQGEWKFDPKYWPDPEGMCAELKKMGIKPIVSIWPTINPKSENFAEMNDSDMLVRTENGQFGTFSFYGQQTFIDATNPETGRFVWNIVKKNYFDKGIHSFWLDEAEPEVHPQQFGHLRFFLGNGAQTALLYPYYYAKMFYDGLREAGEDEIILLTRAAYIGSQKYGAAVWNGDIPSTWTALRQSVTSGLSMGICGIPWWTSDIGGFYGADIESDDFRELIVRWFQFGLFSPIMRLHGARNKLKDQVKRNPDIIEPSGGPNEIWRFGDKAYGIIKGLIETRERMRPYIDHYLDISSKTGAPIMRPMFFDFYNDPVCYTMEDQYMFGADVLFAPILNRGQTAREVYLPEGNWVNINDRRVYEGKRTLSVRAELDQYIAFVKEGSDAIRIFNV